MKLAQEFNCKCQLRAQITEDGELSVMASATAVYDPANGSTTTAKCEVSEEMQAKIQAVLAEAMKECEVKLPMLVMDAIAVSRQVGQRLGEVAK